MVGRLLLGTGAAALMAGCSIANAADVSPVAVVPVAQVATAAAGPSVYLNLEQTIGARWLGGPITPFAFTAGEVDVRTRSGWGFILRADSGYDLALPPFGDLRLYGEIYRAFGDLEVGAGAEYFSSFPLGVGFWAVSLVSAIRYDTPTLDLETNTWFEFPLGAFDRWSSWTAVTFTPSERIEVEGRVALTFDSVISVDLAGDAKVGIRGPLGIRTGFALSVLPAPVSWYIYGGPELDLRGVTPYAVGWAQSDGTRGVDFGVDVERQIADGPFWLIGRSWLRIGNVPTSARAEIGIRFERGEH